MAKIHTFYTVAPISVLDIPVGGTDMTIFTDFIKYNEVNEPIGRYTLREYCLEVDSNRKILYTKDGEYFYFGWNLSDLENNMGKIKELMTAYGYILGGLDFTNPDIMAYWILNADELSKWLKETIHNNIEEPIIE